MAENKLRTSAQISEDEMFWLFGVEFGMIDCSINSMDDLEKLVDKQYTKQQIIDLTLNPAL